MFLTSYNIYGKSEVILCVGQQKRHRHKEQTFGLWVERVERFEKIALNRQPVRVRCMTQGTQSQCSVTTWRDGVGREGEGGTE